MYKNAKYLVAFFKYRAIKLSRPATAGSFADSYVEVY